MKTFLVFDINADAVVAHNLPIGHFSIPLPNATAISAARTLVGIADLGDKIPGDGKVEESLDAKIPVKLHLGFINVNQQVPVHVDAVASIVERLD